MKVPVNQLVKLVNELVEKRVRELLPEAVARVLSERYIRQVVTEPQSTPARPRSALVQEMRVADEEPEDVSPQPVRNDRPRPPRRDEAVRKLTGGNPLLEAVFDGVQPIPAEGSEASALPDVPVEKMESAGFDFGRMVDLARMDRRVASEVAPQTAPTNVERQREAERLDRALAARRAALEVPFRG